MKTTTSILIILTFIFGCIICSHAQPVSSSNWEEAPPEFTRQFIERSFKPRLPENLNKGGDDWSAVIDAAWGTGAPTATKLAIFDQYWDTVDSSFACFHGIEDTWDELRDLYRPEIEQGVSRGRFIGILDQLSLSLRESHTGPIFDPVYNSQLLPGVPLMFIGGWGDLGHFGAGLTPLLDSSLLVYDVVAVHPMGLELGDRVLGYDGMAWKDCYPQLIEHNLPVTGFWWGSSPSSYDHSFLMAAGMNWHLFDTIDIVKYGSGDTLHLPTSLLAGSNMNIFCTEQIDIPGVLKPNWGSQELFSYGIVDGTNIGYIYGWGFWWDAEAEFLDAVETLMNEYETDGLIIDFRMNYGGNMFLSNMALDLLFDETISTLDSAYRCDPADHLALCPGNVTSTYTFGQEPNGYDQPIALLTGPGSISSGDQVALRIKLHPQTRVFGKSTASAFNSPTDIGFSTPGWSGSYAVGNYYFTDNPNNYLTHTEFEVDEEVWHTPEAVANGEDAVVNAAIAWINSMTTSTQEIPQLEASIIFPNPGNTQLTVDFENLDFQNGTITIYNSIGQMVYSQNLQTGEQRKLISLHGFSEGTYFLKISDGERQETHSFIIAR